MRTSIIYIRVHLELQSTTRTLILGIDFLNSASLDLFNKLLKDIQVHSIERMHQCFNTFQRSFIGTSEQTVITKSLRTVLRGIISTFRRLFPSLPRFRAALSLWCSIRPITLSNLFFLKTLSEFEPNCNPFSER